MIGTLDDSREIAFTSIQCQCGEQETITTETTAAKFMEDHTWATGHVEYTIGGYHDQGGQVDSFERPVRYGVGPDGGYDPVL